MAAGQKEVIIGHKLKKELGAKLGDDVVFLGATQDGAMSSMRLKLVGVIADHLMFNKRAFIPLAQGQYFTDMEDNVTELLVYGSHFNDALKVADGLRAAGGIGEVEVNAWQEISPWKEAFTGHSWFYCHDHYHCFAFSGFGDLEYIYDVYFRAPRGNRCDARHGLNEIQNIGDDYFRSLLDGSFRDIDWACFRGHSHLVSQYQWYRAFRRHSRGHGRDVRHA